MPSFRHRLLLFVAVALAFGWWGLMFLGTHLPMPPKTHVNMSDKLQHALAYAGWAFLVIGVVRAFRPRRWSTYLVVIAVGAAYGVADELTQLLVPNRSAELLDWLADLTGLALGAATFAVVDWIVLPSKPWAREQTVESTVHL